MSGPTSWSAREVLGALARPSRRMQGCLAALTAITLWGASFIATKLALREVSPLAVVTTRLLVGLAALQALLLLRRESILPARAALPWIAAMGIVGVAVHQSLQAAALTLTTAISTGWLISLTPAWSALLARAWLGERLTASRGLGLVLALSGALAVMASGASGRLSLAGATLGDALIVVSTLTWAGYTIISRRVTREVGALRATAGAMIVGLVVLLPVFLAGGGAGEWTRLSSTAWAALAFLGLGCSAAGYLLWQMALERLDATRVAAFLYVEPLVTLACAVLVLGEGVSAMAVAGGGLVLAGVALVQRDR